MNRRMTSNPQDDRIHGHPGYRHGVSCHSVPWSGARALKALELSRPALASSRPALASWNFRASTCKVCCRVAASMSPHCAAPRCASTSFGHPSPRRRAALAQLSFLHDARRKWTGRARCAWHPSRAPGRRTGWWHTCGEGLLTCTGRARVVTFTGVRDGCLSPCPPCAIFFTTNRTLCTGE